MYLKIFSDFPCQTFLKNPTQNSIGKATKDPIPSTKQDLRTT